MALTPFEVLGGIKIVTDIFGGVSSRKTANAAAAKAQAAANFNAEIIMRDVDILTKQREIINANYEINRVRGARFFERDVQGKARANYSYANIDFSDGTRIQVMRESGREHDFTLKRLAF